MPAFTQAVQCLPEIKLALAKLVCMKPVANYHLLLLCLLFATAGRAQMGNQQPVFTLHEAAAVCEGMAFDPVDSNFYFGESFTSCILRYTKEGKPAGRIDAARDGLLSVLGISVSPAHHLWVCGAMRSNGKKLRCVFQYSLKDGKLINRYPDTSGKAGFFNDVAVTRDGAVFTTCTDAKTLYKLDTVNKIAVPYFTSDSLLYCNGITASGNLLYVSTARGFARVNTVNKQLTLVKLKDWNIAGIDGLYFYENSLIGIQNVFFPAAVTRYYLDDSGMNLRHAEVLFSAHPPFMMPTTGAIIGDAFYYMPNSNIRHYDFDNDRAKDTGNIKKITVVKLPAGKKLENIE